MIVRIASDLARKSEWIFFELNLCHPSAYDDPGSSSCAVHKQRLTMSTPALRIPRVLLALALALQLWGVTSAPTYVRLPLLFPLERPCLTLKLMRRHAHCLSQALTTGVLATDETPNKFTIWTQVTPSQPSTDTISVSWKVTRDRSLKQVVISGTSDTSAASLWVVRVSPKHRAVCQ